MAEIDRSGQYPAPLDNVLLLAEGAEVQSPVTLIHFNRLEPSEDVVFSPLFTLIWNPLKQYGPVLYRPVVLIVPEEHTVSMVEKGGVRFRRISDAPQVLTQEQPVYLPSMRTGEFTKIAVGVVPLPEYFTDSSLLVFHLLFFNSYFKGDGMPVFNPEELGARATFPAYVGGRPSMVRFGEMKVTVYCTIKEIV